MGVATLFRSSNRMIRTTDLGAKELLPTMTIEMPSADTDFLPGSRDVNIILMVQEHVPRRLEMIHKELQEMRERQQKLEHESRTLQRLFEALEG